MERELQLKMNIPEMSNSGHAYLDELEGEARPYSYYHPDDERQEKWQMQRDHFGFDDSETWDLNATFYAWLYEHLRMYVEVGGKVVNLSFHEFGFEGVAYSQIEIIEMILQRIRFFFSDDYDEWDNPEDVAYVNEIGKLWALILPAMWW